MLKASANSMPALPSFAQRSRAGNSCPSSSSIITSTSLVVLPKLMPSIIAPVEEMLRMRTSPRASPTCSVADRIIAVRTLRLTR